jgi:signal transduction histidine kinase
MALSSARQTLSLLRSQAQAGRIDAGYMDQRLGAIEQVMENIISERKDAASRERLARLYDASRVIGSSLDLQTVLSQVMDALIALTGAERGFLMLLDDDGNLKVRVARNFDQETLDSTSQMSRTVTRKVLETGQPIVTTNAQEDPRFAGQASVMMNALRSIMACALRTRGEIIGVVYLDNRIKAGLFSEGDLELLDAFAGQAGIAIENARLFGATDQALSVRVEELTMLQRVDRQLNETLDMTKAMNITLEWSTKVCNAQTGSLGLIDPESNTIRILVHFGGSDTFSAQERIPLDHPLIKPVIGSQEPIVSTENGVSTLTVPVRRENKVIGIIAMTAQGDNPFKGEAQALVTRMADRAAIAIENARLYDAVRAANNAKSEFVSLVAHELKVPMTSISGYADLLPMAGPVNERQTQFINTIKGAVNKMKVLVSDLSDISRIESGHLRVDLSDVSVIEALNSAIEGTITEIEARGHKLITDVSPDLPAVRADKDRLAQILLNLVSNAYKYTPNGGTITIRAQRNDGKVALSVTDTGVGMSPDQIEKLGTKFWRADNGLQQPGTGLGFAITRNLIDLMHGELAISSDPGKGTSFTVKLPIA